MMRLRSVLSLMVLGSIFCFSQRLSKPVRADVFPAPIPAELPPLASSPTQFFVNGAFQAGFSSIPYQSPWYGVMGANFLLQCKDSKFCDKFQPSFLRTNLEFSFSNKPNIAGSNMPFAKMGLDAIGIAVHRNIFLDFGNVRLTRSVPTTIDEAVNLQVTPMIARFHGNFERDVVVGSCEMGISLPGYKRVNYAPPNANFSASIPFNGVHLGGMENNCRIGAGPSVIKFFFGVTAGSQVAIGSSGAGNVDIVGPWGALEVEAWAKAEVGIWFKLPERARKNGLAALELGVPGFIRYHRNMDCLESISGTPNCSNSAYGLETGFSVMVRLIWNTPGGSNPRPAPFQAPFHRTAFGF